MITGRKKKSLFYRVEEITSGKKLILPYERVHLFFPKVLLDGTGESMYKPDMVRNSFLVLCSDLLVINSVFIHALYN